MPPYSPELSPDELVNADLKRSLPKGHRVGSQAELAAETRRFFRRRRRQPHIVRGSFHGRHVRYTLGHPSGRFAVRGGFRQAGACLHCVLPQTPTDRHVTARHGYIRQARIAQCPWIYGPAHWPVFRYAAQASIPIAAERLATGRIPPGGGPIGRGAVETRIGRSAGRRTLALLTGEDAVCSSRVPRPHPTNYAVIIWGSRL
ncbi:hypothetical protein ACODT5_39410 [Streptomyces sp. 5.8]|uniref:hypothetical protein n=1 Tax=Streptomyces sp. 5.8 TaxID=3406571 RepID=UPI003BB6FF4E